MKKYFANLDEADRCIIESMCKAIESQRCFIISTEKRWKFMVPAEDGSYVYDYTYNLIRFGFTRKARNNDFQASQHSYCPHQYTSGVLSNFLNPAVDMGLYERTTERKFDGGTDFQMIWM